MASNFQWKKGGSSQGKPGYIISFDFDRLLIQRLKDTIPAQYREWHPGTLQWWVSEFYQKALDDLFPGFLEAVVATKPLFVVEAEKSIEELWPDG